MISQNSNIKRMDTQINDLVIRNEQWIPGGVVSLNRKADPNICFVKGKGSRVWDIEGKEYIDYQAGFAASFLGHNDDDINQAVLDVISNNHTLMGAGPTDLEGEFAELFCQCIPTADKLQITTTGSEATYHAIRIARAATQKDHVIIIQGGYNGWHNDVAANVISDLSTIGSRISRGEYPLDPLSAGIPDVHKSLIHVVNFNDLESVEFLAKKYPISCIILEPILQNIGIVKPQDNYLLGLRELADVHGFLLIFDEVKTGFRHAIGGYQSICNIQPDLSTFGKAVANGYPFGVIAGKKEYMEYFVHPDKDRRVLIAGTFNAHPFTTAAAIATLRKLADPKYAVYDHVENLGVQLEKGLEEALKVLNTPYYIGRQGSAFCIYFMDHQPVDFHDVMLNHDLNLDKKYRLKLIEKGIFNFPMPIKQGSISFAHSTEDIAITIEKTKEVFFELSQSL